MKCPGRTSCGCIEFGPKTAETQQVLHGDILRLDHALLKEQFRFVMKSLEMVNPCKLTFYAGDSNAIVHGDIHLKRPLVVPGRRVELAEMRVRVSQLLEGT